MFTAERKTNVFIVEWLAYSVIVGYALRIVAIDLLSFMPVEDVELYLSILILVSEVVLFSGLMTSFSFFPPSVYIGAGHVLVILCVNFEPTYIPLLVRLLTILTCIASAVIYYCTSNQKRWSYIYQFELLDNVKCLLYFFLISFLFDVIDTAGYASFYLLTILPILILMGLVYFIGKKILSIKLFCVVYTFSLICLSIYDYRVYGEFYRSFGYMLMPPMVFILSRQLYRKRTVLLLLIANLCNFIPFCLNVFKMLGEPASLFLNWSQFFFNLTMVVAIFVKLPIKQLKQWLAPFSGDYDQKTVLLQVNSYAASNKVSTNFWGSSFIAAVEYANIKWSVNLDLDSIKRMAAQDDSIFEEVPVAPMPIVFGVLRYFFNAVKIHWKVPAGLLLLVFCLTVTYPGIHRATLNLFQEPPLILEITYYADSYAIETLEKLERGEDITTQESFSQYFERIYKGID